MPDTVSMFNKAKNINIKNSSVTKLTCNDADVLTTAPEVNLDRLFAEVAPNAILNADGRADEVRCYPGTREEVIGKVEKWMSGEGRRMMWLSGPAGAGKSAICQTVAERCGERGQHEANFFFFRGDATRNHAQPLVATLVYQLRRLYPGLDAPLADCLMADPLIFNASLNKQFLQLISSPTQTLRRSSLINKTIVLIIDGLDECDNKRKQEQILIALSALANADHSPFLVLVVSCAEPHLVMSFNRIGSLAESIFLDGEYKPQDDIRHFVVGKFNEIKAVHSLAHMLTGDWPSKADIDTITDKSSGQFIYAATVMRFIECSPDSPALSLRIIIKMQPAAGHSPYTQLDALYSHIFSQSRDVRRFKLILGAHFVTESWGRTYFGYFLRLIKHEAMEIELLFVDFGAIVQVTTCPPNKLVFYHASLSDYLLDKSRSGPYHVNKSEIAAALALTSLENFHDSHTLNITILVLNEVEEATATLSKSLLHASGQKLDEHLHFQDYWFVLIRTIDKLYFQTDHAMFKIMLQHWVCFGYRNSITNLDKVDTDDLTPSALKYYTWYLTTERLKLALGLSK